MRTRTIATLFALAGVLGLSACDKKDEKKEDKKADAKKADAKTDEKTDEKADEKTDEKAEPAADGGDAAKPAVAVPVELTDLGLKAEAPAETSVGKAIVGDGVMVQGPNLVATVEIASDSRPKTEEDAKKESEMYTPKNFVSEKLEDGFAVTFDNEGGMGANYFVNVRRDIGGKSYWCETTASTVEQQSTALAFCKSLKQ